jgi:hypothetical protein
MIACPVLRPVFTRRFWMMKHFQRAGAFVLLVFIAAGVTACGHKPAKQTPVVRIGVDEPMRMSKATEDADYVLYAAGDQHAIMTVSLKTGDDLGFHKEGDRVIAVAGANEKSLPNGAYVWKRR